MKVLLVGAGPMAQAYAAVLRAQNAEVMVVGRGARSADGMRQATDLHVHEGGIAAYLDRRNPAEIEAAIIALPVQALADATIRLIEAGVPRILVEKPAGLTMSEIDDVTQAAVHHKASVFVAYNRRFYASVVAARNIVVSDGGVTSFHFEFTELAGRIALPGRDPVLLQNWFLANSSHVIDLAFHLCGTPVVVQSQVCGTLDWHPVAVFAGHGRTQGGALFSYHADWSSAGRWGLDIRTRKRRLLLQPLEGLKMQEKDGFALVDVEIDDAHDKRYKPGLYRQVEAFLSADPAGTALPNISSHARAVRQYFLPILEGCAA